MSTPSPEPAPPPGAVLLVIVAAYLMVGVDATVMNVALPAIRQDLNFTDTTLSWVLNTYTLAFGGLLLLGGRTGDLLGRRRTLTLGVLVFTVASLLGGLAPDGTWLLVARALQGIGAALTAPSTLALITSTFPDGPRRHHALGVYSSTAGIGASVGLVLGGMLTSWASWRWALLINIPVGAAIVAALPRYVPETPRHKGELDVKGALAGTLGTTSLVYGFIEASERGWTHGTTLAAFATAAVLLCCFTLVEARAAQPLMPLRLLADRNRAGAYAGVMLVPAGMFGAFYFLTLISQQALHYSPLRTGFAFLPLTVALFTTVRYVPRLLARLGAKPLMLTGTALLTASATWLWRIEPGDGYAAGLLGPLLLTGLGIGLCLMPLNATILANVRPHEAGSASGLLQTCQWLGGTVGLTVLVTVYGTAARDARGTPGEILTEGASHAFGAGALISLAALLTVALVLRTPRTPAPPQAVAPQQPTASPEAGAPSQATVPPEAVTRPGAAPRPPVTSSSPPPPDPAESAAPRSGTR
ncbi:MFS transporter [Streptomyces acidiscabies]|uniref:MFS transporter n=1 Tax=Streptomyces acidiscabies TaxID=42234 RepID=UPI0009526513|nr:MFS transporter [Streptomyces acidiscabies]